MWFLWEVKSLVLFSMMAVQFCPVPHPPYKSDFELRENASFNEKVPATLTAWWVRALC